MSETDTIYALTTPRAPSGVAIVRVSGTKAKSVADRICGGCGAGHVATLRELRDPTDNRLIDRGLVLYFPEGASFTGEDVVELHIHGSIAVIDLLLSVLGKSNGLRQAQAGEFTKRALTNNVLDLLEVEGLSDLIKAETEAQHRQSTELMQGRLRSEVDVWRSNLLKIMSNLDASIDFDDEDLPTDLLKSLAEDLSNVINALDAERAGVGAAEIIRSGLEVAIVGKPNVGKSSLLNVLAGRDAAIISEVAGTTRDVIEVRMDIGGHSVTLLDTAGLRESNDAIEKIGIDRAKLRAKKADVRVALLECREDLDDLGVDVRPHDLVFLSKSDISKATGFPALSSLSGEGVDDLIQRISDITVEITSGATGVVRQRHADALGDASSSLGDAVCRLRRAGADIELVGEDVRRAMVSLDVLIGKVDVEDVLGEIFSNFCIGK